MITIKLPKQDITKALRVIAERPDALWGERDTKAMMNRIKTSAKKGVTGFTFRTDYSEPYATKYNKQSGNYMHKSGTMLRSLAYRKLRKGDVTVWQVFFEDREIEIIFTYLEFLIALKSCN